MANPSYAQVGDGRSGACGRNTDSRRDVLALVADLGYTQVVAVGNHHAALLRRDVDAGACDEYFAVNVTSQCRSLT